MRSKLLFVAIILLIATIFLIQRKGIDNLVIPNFGRTTESINKLPNASPNAPKQYNFDSSTDLKKEFESINPQVLESDFN